MFAPVGACNSELSAAQSLMLSQCLKKVQEAVNSLSAIHKDRHGSVSKVGKAIDRVSMSHDLINMLIHSCINISIIIFMRWLLVI